MFLCAIFVSIMIILIFSETTISVMDKLDRIYSDVDNFYIQSKKSFNRGFTVKPNQKWDSLDPFFCYTIRPPVCLDKNEPQNNTAVCIHIIRQQDQLLKHLKLHFSCLLDAS